MACDELRFHELHEVVRVSFGQEVFYDPVRKQEYSVCGDHAVRMNGPGSDRSWYGRLWLWWSKKFEPEMFKITTPASDVHDMDYHKGPKTETYRKECDRRHYRHNQDSCDRFFEIRMRELKHWCEDFAAFYKKVPGFWESLFDGRKRDYRKCRKELDRLISLRKKVETYIELQRTALAIWGAAHCDLTPCEKRDLSKENDVWELCRLP